MPFTSHQHPTLSKYGGKFCENMIARPKLSTRLFASLFFCKNEVCMHENRYINSVMLQLFFLESGQSRGGE